MAVDPAATGVALGVLAALVLFVGWPIAALLPGLSAGAPWRVVVGTLAVALSSTALVLTLSVAVAHVLVRADIPGRALLWRMLRVGLVLPPFLVPLALLVVAGRARSGYSAIVLGQALAFLPHGAVLVVRALSGVPPELGQAARVLGATRLTTWRRVTLGMAGPRLLAAALVVLGLCLADVATPLLLGGEALVLATTIVAAAAVDGHGAAGPALVLAALATGVTLAARTGRQAVWIDPGVEALPRPGLGVSPLARRALAAGVWMVTWTLVLLWLLVPLGSVMGATRPGPSLEHWAALAGPTAGWPLAHSLALGSGTALAGTALALAAAWVRARGWAPLEQGVTWLARVPAAVPGVVGSLGFLLAFGAPSTTGPSAPIALVAVVACWELPVLLALARCGLAGCDRSAEQVALSLGAGRCTILRRVVLPAVRPMVGRLLGHAFASGALAVGPVIVLAGSGPALGSITMLDLAASGHPGVACALATALLALAGGAGLLGRTLAVHRRAAGRSPAMPLARLA